MSNMSVEAAENFSINNPLVHDVLTPDLRKKALELVQQFGYKLVIAECMAFLEEPDMYENSTRVADVPEPDTATDETHGIIDQLFQILQQRAAR